MMSTFHTSEYRPRGAPSELSIPPIHTGMCSQITWVSEALLRLTDLQISHTDQYKALRMEDGAGAVMLQRWGTSHWDDAK